MLVRFPSGRTAGNLQASYEHNAIHFLLLRTSESIHLCQTAALPHLATTLCRLILFFLTDISKLVSITLCSLRKKLLATHILRVYTSWEGHSDRSTRAWIWTSSSIFQGRALSLLCTLQEPGFSSSGKLLSEAVFFKTHINPLQTNRQGMQTPCCNFCAAQCTPSICSDTHTRRGTFASNCLVHMETFPDIPKSVHVVFLPTFTNQCHLLSSVSTMLCLFKRMTYTIYAAFILFILYFVLVATGLLGCVHCLTAHFVVTAIKSLWGLFRFIFHRWKGWLLHEPCSG